MTILKAILLMTLLGPAVRAMLFTIPASSATQDRNSPIAATTTSPTTSQATKPADAQSRFETVDIYLDTGNKPLAAYQIELRATTHNVLLAGIEGGEHPAFAKPPYYDTHALLDERIILAALSTDAELPSGKTRVARLTVQVIGPKEPAYELKVHATAGPDGTPLRASATVQPSQPRT